MLVHLQQTVQAILHQQHVARIVLLVVGGLVGTVLTYHLKVVLHNLRVVWQQQVVLVQQMIWIVRTKTVHMVEVVHGIIIARIVLDLMKKLAMQILDHDAVSAPAIVIKYITIVRSTMAMKQLVMNTVVTVAVMTAEIVHVMVAITFLAEVVEHVVHFLKWIVKVVHISVLAVAHFHITFVSEIIIQVVVRVENTEHVAVLHYAQI